MPGSLSRCNRPARGRLTAYGEATLTAGAAARYSLMRRFAQREPMDTDMGPSMVTHVTLADLTWLYRAGLNTSPPGEGDVWLSFQAVTDPVFSELDAWRAHRAALDAKVHRTITYRRASGATYTISAGRRGRLHWARLPRRGEEAPGAPGKGALAGG